MNLEKNPKKKDKHVHSDSDNQKEYVCPMHPEIQSDEPSRCSICKMNLEKVAGQENPQVSSDDLVGLSLVIPMSSVLDSGLRKIVYVDKGENIFESREVVLGRRSGHYFPVLSGLKQGERVVVKGGFLIDSQFQIMGSPSLFYPGGLYADSSESGESKHNGSIKKDRISEELNEDISEEDSAPCH